MKSTKWLIRMGLAVVLIVAFTLPACTGGGGGEGGVHRLAIGTLADVPNLNMDQSQLEHTNMGCLYKTLVYEHLGSYHKVGGSGDDANEFVPCLATGYDVTYEKRYHPVNKVMQDAQVWTVHLREDVKWHDGEDFTAEDVEFTLKHSLSEWDPAKPICWEHYWTTWRPVWWLNVTGTHTIELIYEHNITEAHPPSWWQWDCIIPKHVFGPLGAGNYTGWAENATDWDGEHIGTGPFKFVEHVIGDHHKWVRNDDWWGTDDSNYGPIEIEELWIQIYPSTETLTASFEAGEIDTSVVGFNYVNIPTFEADPDITVEIVPGLAKYYLGFDLYTDDYYPEVWGDPPVLNYTANPLHDLELRKAIAYAINTTKIIDVVLHDYALPSDSWMYVDSPGHKSGLNMYECDPAEAASILEGEGYYLDDGKWYSPYTNEKLEFTIRTENTVTESDIGQSIVEDLNAFGIDTTHIPVDPTTYYNEMYVPDKGWDMFISSEEPSADPYSDWIWALLTDPWGWGWDWAPTFWVDPEFNEWYEALYTHPNPQVARDELQVIANEELPMYMLFEDKMISAYRTDKWTNWYNELGGPVTWFNPWSIYEVEWVGD